MSRDGAPVAHVRDREGSRRRPRPPQPSYGAGRTCSGGMRAPATPQLLAPYCGARVGAYGESSSRSQLTVCLCLGWAPTINTLFCFP